MIEKITNQNQIARHKLAEKINELVDAVNEQQQQLNNHWCRLVALESDNENIKDVFDQLHPELKIVRTLTQVEPADPYADQQDEVWKDVVGYEGLYRISNQGTVCRLYKNGKVNFMTPRILNGYWRVKLCNGNTQKEYFLHRLIAQAFIPNPENKPEINHINGIKTDNRIENLEWVTRSENAIHATKTGLLKYSEYRYNRTRDVNSKPVMCVETRKIYTSCTEAAKDIKTDAAHIGECISGKRSTAGSYHWKLVSIIDAYNSTRRALDVARNGLEYIFGYEGVPKYVVKHIRQVLDQIKNETALEQKDVK